jgi:spermidine synthase
MLRSRLLDGTTTEDGRELELYQRGDERIIRIDGWELMSSRCHGSEEAMARLTLEAGGPRRAPRWLVGGLGMGFTLRACLDLLGPDATVVVAEVFPAVVEWNRGPLGPLAGHPLDDPRTEVAPGDVYDRLDPAGEPFDAVLLDVDNGPEALTLASNKRLYSPRGLERLRRGLRPGGVLAIWSAGSDNRFAAQLGRAGFEVACHRVRARTEGRGPRHAIFVAKTGAS